MENFSSFCSSGVFPIAINSVRDKRMEMEGESQAFDLLLQKGSFPCTFLSPAMVDMADMEAVFGYSARVEDKVEQSCRIDPSGVAQKDGAAPVMKGKKFS